MTVKLVVCSNTEMHQKDTYRIQFPSGEQKSLFVSALLLEGVDQEGDGFGMRFKEPSVAFLREFCRLYMTQEKYALEYGMCETCQGFSADADELLN